YRGSDPGSEPETKALMHLAEAIAPKIHISYHSFSEMVIYPFGCSPERIPVQHRSRYESMGRSLASKLVRDSGAGTYRAGTTYELLYNADGGAPDYMYQKFKTLSFVIEINASSQGF